MGMKELAAKVAAEHADIPANKVTALVRATLKALHQELTDTTEKTVKLPPLGSFVLVTKAAGEDDGEGRRKVHLRLTKPKDEAEAAEGAPEAKNAEKKAAKAASPERVAKKAERQAGKADKQAARKAAKAQKPAA